MRKTLLIFASVIIFLFSELGDALAQDGSTARIYGRIILPAVKKKERTFRGRLYRNRLVSSKSSGAASGSDRSSYEDVVIAAYPLSFNVQVKPMPNARVIQRNATFIPNVLPITPGTTVEFVNADRFFHNVFSITPGAKFNIGRRPTNDIVRRTISTRGKVSLFCDIHSQMASTIISLDTPYFTTANRRGVYLLENLPPGKYRIEIIHPNFETVTAEVTLAKGESSEQSFTLSE